MMVNSKTAYQPMELRLTVQGKSNSAFYPGDAPPRYVINDMLHSENGDIYDNDDIQHARSGSRWRYWLRLPVFLILLAGVSIAGGLLNRIRGGWIPISQLPDDSDFTHDLLQRMIFGLPTGAFVALMGGFRKSTLFPSIIVGVWTTFSLYVGWGAYFSMGRGVLPSRAGAFDWMLGGGGTDEDYTGRWLREATGMALRGAVQTIVPGYAMYLYGMGPLYLLFGPTMAFVYEMAYDIPANQYADFASGPALAEFMWGWATWFVLGLAVYNAAQARELPGWFPDTNKEISVLGCMMCVNPSGSRLRSKRQVLVATGRAMLHLLVLAFEAILIASAVWYAGVSNPDERNKFQTFFGIAIVASAALLLHLLHVASVCCIYRNMRLLGLGAQDARYSWLHSLLCAKCCESKRFQSYADEDLEHDRFRFLDGKLAGKVTPNHASDPLLAKPRNVVIYEPPPIVVCMDKFHKLFTPRIPALGAVATFLTLLVSIVVAATVALSIYNAVHRG